MPQPTVTIPAGRLAGREIATPHGAVAAYLGIPYARPPIGPQRFAAPVPADPWPGTLDATQFGPSPIQETSGPSTEVVPGMLPRETSEDCLTLNVWVPAGAAGTDLPVLVWIYGGAFASGGTAFATYDAAQLAAEQQVIVVSINYRVGALGFLDLREVGGDEIGAATNVGLRDQLLALQWVQDSVAAFGGDRQRVTVIGESAGAGSIVHLIGAPASAGLFRRAITHSPGVEFIQHPDLSAVVARAVLERVGVDSAKALLDTSTDALLAAQVTVSTELLGKVGAMVLHPYLDDDLVRDPPLTAFAAGAGRDVDLLIGATADEMRLYLDPRADAMDEPALARWAAGFLRCDDSVAGELVAGYLTRYPKGSELIAAVLTDRTMRLPIYALADRHQGSTYAYSFDWGAPVRGAFHAIDLPFIFDTFDAGGWAEFLGINGSDGAAARRLGAALRTAWAAFAATGDPSCEAVGAWPEYDGQRRAMRLNAQVTPVEDPVGAVRDLWAGLPVPNLRANGAP